MRLTVIIASTGRRDILGSTLHRIAAQTRLPDEVVISAVSAEDVPALDPALTGAECRFVTLLGPRGSCAQRNRALEEVLPRSDIIVFFDDDFLPAPDYLSRLEQAFADNPRFSVIHGNVVADGARNAGYSLAEGGAILDAAVAKPRPPREVQVHPGAYGCNMSLRGSLVGANRFDERLVLYGWQEDIDFTARVGSTGCIVALSDLLGVHLGSKGARVSGQRLGYSQVVNPMYLVGKGTMPVTFAFDLVFRNLAANLVKSLSPEPWIDRRGRLRGNTIGLWHVITGRIEPEYVLHL